MALLRRRLALALALVLRPPLPSRIGGADVRARQPPVRQEEAADYEDDEADDDDDDGGCVHGCFGLSGWWSGWYVLSRRW